MAAPILASTGSQRHLTVLAGLAVVGYSVFLAIASPQGFPSSMRVDSRMPFLCDKPVGEDAYYMLLAAWNLGAGKGLIANEGLPVTGVQPLSTVAYGFLAWILQAAGGDLWTLPRAVLLLNALLIVGFAHQIGVIARLLSEAAGELSYWIGFALVVFSFAVFREFTYGLETGFYLLFLATMLRTSLTVSPSSPWSRVLLLGVLAGLCGLSRIDFGVILLLFLASNLLRKSLKFSQCLVVGAVAALIVLPWPLWVHSVSGHWMPSSGPAQGELISAASAAPRLKAMGLSVLENLAPWFYPGTRNVIYAASFVTLALLAAMAVIKRNAFAVNRPAVQRFLNWVIALSALPVIYCLFFWATHFYPRYTAPLQVIAFPLAAIVLAQAGKALLGSAIPRLAVPIMAACCFAVFAVISLHSGRIGNGHTVTAGFIQQHFPTQRVGCFQSGVIGYFNPNVYNLDGKLSRDALAHLRDKTLDVYLEKSGIEILLDWPSYIHSGLSDEALKNWKLQDLKPDNGITECYVRNGSVIENQIRAEIGSSLSPPSGPP